MNEWPETYIIHSKTSPPITEAKQEWPVHPPGFHFMTPCLCTAACTFPFTHSLCDLPHGFGGKTVWLTERQHNTHTGSAVTFSGWSLTAIYCVTLGKVIPLPCSLHLWRECRHLPLRAAVETMWVNSLRASKDCGGHWTDSPLPKPFPTACLRSCLYLDEVRFFTLFESFWFPSNSFVFLFYHPWSSSAILIFFGFLLSKMEIRTIPPRRAIMRIRKKRNT